jgi:hypothetical protein
MAMLAQGFWYGSSLVQNLDTSERKDIANKVMTGVWCSVMAMQYFKVLMRQMTGLEKGRAPAAGLNKLVSTGPLPNKHLANQIVPTYCNGEVIIKNVGIAVFLRKTLLTVVYRSPLDILAALDQFSSMLILFS